MILRNIFYLTLAISLGLVGVAPRPSQAQVLERVFATPQDMLQAYYGAINIKDFTTAYNLRLNPTEDLTTFATGFSDTVRVETYWGNFKPAPTPIMGEVQSVLVAYKTDGRVETYGGCFMVARSTLQKDWKIVNADLSLLIPDHSPGTGMIRAMLMSSCATPLSGIPVQFGGESNPKDSLHFYFDMLNQKDYTGAYSWWLSPTDGLSTDYRQTFNAFAAGYADTRYISVYIGDYVFAGAATGHPYLDGFQPVVLVAQMTDDSFIAYSGCYIMGNNQTLRRLGIVNGQFYEITNNVPTGLEILDLFPTDCTVMAIPF